MAGGGRMGGRRGWGGRQPALWLVAAGGSWQPAIGRVAGGGRVGGSQRLGNVNTEYTEHWDTGADNIQHTT